jgi:hypothetical protein
MRILIAVFALSSLVLFSCQKEADFANGNNGGGGGGNNTSLLKKIVSKSGSDSSVVLFGYNSSQKLTSFDAVSAIGGVDILIQERAERNAQGIIQKLIIKSDQYTQFGIDSVVTVMNYSSGRYNSKVTTIDLGVFALVDSIALVYDATGKVVTERSYSDFGLGGYEEIGKIDYTYNGNNVASIKNYSYDSGTSSYDLLETYTYDQYDNKISPIYTGIEAFVFDSPLFYSSNNPTKSSITSSGSTETYTTTYTYNSSNKPLTGSSIIQPGNTTTTATYFYQ